MQTTSLAPSKAISWPGEPAVDEAADLLGGAIGVRDGAATSPAPKCPGVGWLLIRYVADPTRSGNVELCRSRRWSTSSTARHRTRRRR